MALGNPLYWWESLYNPQEIKKINTLLKRDLISTRAQQGADGVIKTSKVKGVPWKKAKPYLNKFYESTLFRNNYAFGFQLFSLNEEGLNESKVVVGFMLDKKKLEILN